MNDVLGCAKTGELSANHLMILIIILVHNDPTTCVERPFSDATHTMTLANGSAILDAASFQCIHRIREM